MRKFISSILILSIIISGLVGVNIKEIEASTNTEVRTTLSRSYYEYWRYNNRPTWYKGFSSEGGTQDVQIGSTPTYTFTHSYYRSLNPGEKVKSVRIKPGTISSISSSDFSDSKYTEYNSVSWDRFEKEEYIYRDKNASVSVSSTNLTGTNPTIDIKVTPKLLPEAQAKDVTDTATIPPGTSEGFRTYTTFIVEWEIESTEKPGIIEMHIDENTGAELLPSKHFKDLLPGAYYYSAQEITGHHYIRVEVEKPDGSKKEYLADKIKVTVDKNNQVTIDPIEK